MIHFIDQKTCERTPLVATLVGDVCRAVNDGHGAGTDRVVVLGRGEASEAAGLEGAEVIACPRDALVPGGIVAMKRWLKGEGSGRGMKRRMAGEEPWVCWSPRCEMLMSLVLAETLRIMPGDLHRACDAGKLGEADRGGLREEWGVGEQERVAVLLCDDAETIRADRAMLAVGLAGETGRRWRLLLHPGTKNLSMALHVARQMGHGERLILDERVAVTWRVLAGCDAAIWVPGEGGGVGEAGSAGRDLSLAWAMLSGVVVVGEGHRWLEDQRTGLIDHAGRARKLASLLCRVHDNQGEAKAIGQAASVWARERFSPGTVAEWWGRLSRGQG